MRFGLIEFWNPLRKKVVIKPNSAQSSDYGLTLPATQGNQGQAIIKGVGDSLEWGSPSPDLSPYALRSELPNLSGYALASQLPDLGLYTPTTGLSGAVGFISSATEPDEAYPLGGVWNEITSSGWIFQNWARFKLESQGLDGWLSATPLQAFSAMANIAGNSGNSIQIPLLSSYSIIPTSFAIQCSPVPAVNPTGANGQVNSSTNYWTFTLQAAGGGASNTSIISFNTQGANAGVANWNYRGFQWLGGGLYPFHSINFANGQTRFQISAQKTGSSSYQLNNYMGSITYHYYRPGAWTLL